MSGSELTWSIARQSAKSSPVETSTRVCWKRSRGRPALRSTTGTDTPNSSSLTARRPGTRKCLSITHSFSNDIEVFPAAPCRRRHSGCEKRQFPFPKIVVICRDVVVPGRAASCCLFYVRIRAASADTEEILNMAALNVRHFAACLALAMSTVHVASAAAILIGDDKSRPESLTVAPGGVLIVGSASSPFVYKVRPGSFLAEKFIDVSGEGPGTSFLGMLADASSNTLWTCQRTSVPNTSPIQGRSSLRGFDLATGKPKFRWDLPGDNTACNDFAFGSDRALYITDTFTGRIYKLPTGASSAELYLEQELLRGVDGITFLNGTLYVNN